MPKLREDRGEAHLALRATGARLLREARVAEGLSVHALAEQAGVSKASLSMWERGLRDVPMYAQAALAEVLESRVADLFPRDEVELAAAEAMSELRRARPMYQAAVNAEAERREGADSRLRAS